MQVSCPALLGAEENQSKWGQVVRAVTRSTSNNHSSSWQCQWFHPWACSDVRSSSVPTLIHSCLHRDEEADFSSHLRHYVCVCLCMCLWWYTTGGDRRKIYYCLVFLNRSSAVTRTQLTSFWMHRKTVNTYTTNAMRPGLSTLNPPQYSTFCCKWLFFICTH